MCIIHCSLKVVAVSRLNQTKPENYENTTYMKYNKYQICSMATKCKQMFGVTAGSLQWFIFVFVCLFVFFVLFFSQRWFMVENLPMISILLCFFFVLFFRQHSFRVENMPKISRFVMTWLSILFRFDFSAIFEKYIRHFHWISSLKSWGIFTRHA